MDFDDFLDLVMVMSDSVSFVSCPRHSNEYNHGDYIIYFLSCRHQFAPSCHGPSRYLVCLVRGMAFISVCLTLKFSSSDFNDDDAICSKDLNVMLDMLTGGKMEQSIKDRIIEHVSQQYLATMYLLVY